MAIDNKESLISIIMPAYQAEAFIGRAIESVLSQSYENWELLVADDASTDRTCDIVEGYADPRIRLFHEKVNTGSAYLPRELAFKHSIGEYIINLDADDYLEPDYVKKLYGRVKECGADTCCGQMVFVDEKGSCLGNGQCVPKMTFDYFTQMSGKEAFFHTVPGWKIGMNGCMAHRKAWEYAFVRTYKPGKRGIHDDENVSRYLLLWSKKVVFSNAHYYYTVNHDSVTHAFNNRIFDYKNAEADLLKLIGEDFGTGSREYQAVKASDYYAFVHSFNHFARSVDSIPGDELAVYWKKFKGWHGRLDWRAVWGSINRKNQTEKLRYLLNRNYYIEVLWRLLRYKKINGIAALGGRGLKGFVSRRKNSNYYNWYIARKKREYKLRQKINETYKNKSEPDKEFPPYIINVIDGIVESGGLADRLKGILSTYAVCKKLGLQYRLYFTSPFDLQLFLQPNHYDWQVEAEQICKNTRDCKIIILDATQDSKYQFEKQGQYILRHLRRAGKQVQVFTNAGYAYTLDYASLFDELFRPSERLSEAIKLHKERLGERYISISARFLDLLGDFNETHGCGRSLPEKEAQRLIEKSVKEIKKIHKKNPGMHILVNSDSSRFLRAADELDDTYIIPGNITHIDNRQSECTYECYEKTFLDFMMIAGAEKIILLKSKGMYRSGYPYAASRIYRRPFYEVRF